VVKITNKGITVLQEKPAVPLNTQASALDFDRITNAIGFAMQAHKTEFRKGTRIPYIVHPLDVISILLKNGAGEELVIAGVLHDVTEDTDYTLEDVKGKFGDKVASLVGGASEPEELTKGVSREEKRKTWKLRKSQNIEKMKHASGELRLLICADKLANIRDLVTDYRIIGEDVWSKFNASKDEESWYYHGLAEAIVQSNDQSLNLRETVAYKQLLKCIREIFG
jgi:(p)ppGpp synthase/HD superfamily hydrolase